jgi:hypothetical protein
LSFASFADKKYGPQIANRLIRAAALGQANQHSRGSESRLKLLPQLGLPDTRASG